MGTARLGGDGKEIAMLGLVRRLRWTLAYEQAILHETRDVDQVMMMQNNERDDGETQRSRTAQRPLRGESMDVHAPHESIHTWKDFWIHLGTIAIGLLIALALEAGAEKLHHLHQRHQLEADLRAEGVRDDATAQRDLEAFEINREWLLLLRHDVDVMRASGGKIKLAYPVYPKAPASVLPSDAVWATAKESSLLALLPRGKAEVYARLYRQNDLLGNAFIARADARDEMTAFENRFDDAGPGSTPDLSRMTVADLDQYSILLSKDLAVVARNSLRLRMFTTLNQAVLNGEVSDEETLESKVMH